MKISITKVALCCALTTTIFGCSSGDELVKPASTSVPVAQTPSITDKIKSIINDDSAPVNDDLQILKDQLEQQQQQLKAMSDEQQALQEVLKRQSINLDISANKEANAGRNQQGTASTAYIAFLENEQQFTEIEEMATKEVSIIPQRQSSLKLNIPQDAQFIAIKVGLRYTKKRSQLLIPISSLDFDKSLTLNIGACDINIEDGILPELTPTFTTKLKYYQQPLVSCS
ncbi:hypothetical protein [uncultured Psychrobacter sp.]|uniref:hypothetical protein n=1 Tax=Psychrobacter sp. DM8 TaxID=3440636 RepID=UPI00293D9A11|nr:hypothetical protein [uncultured Psychrobacter sp.]